MKISSSYHQQRLWFIDYFEKDYLYEGGPIYHNIPLFIETQSTIGESGLQQIIMDLYKSHEVLRTKLINENGQIYQVIKPLAEVRIENFCHKVDNLKSKTEALRQNPLSFDHLMNVYYEINNEHVNVLFVFHHAIVDRYSLGLLRRDFLNLLQGIQPEKQEIAFKDFSNWQNSLSNDDLESLIFYWKSKLQNLQVLYIPTDNEREQVHLYKSKSSTFRIPKKELVQFSEQNNIDLRIIMLAVYKMTLSRFSGLSDIVIGSFMNLRGESSKKLVGPVENLVVLRSNLDSKNTLLDLCKEIEETWNEAEQYKTMPFDKLVSEINPKKDMSRTALFDILFSYESFEDENENIPQSNEGWGKYDFNLFVKENREDIELILTYNELYFNSNTVQSIIDLFTRIFSATVTSSQKKLTDIPLVSPQEREALINQTEYDAINDQDTIISQFSKQVVQNKNKAALNWASGSLSFKQIDEKSNQLANVLIENFDIQKEDKIAVMLSSQEQIVIALLAVLKSGGAYVPINPDYPDSRKTFILDDAKCKVIIDEKFLENNTAIINTAQADAPDIDILPENLAYIIYTSGTTGMPKGVLIEHRNVINLLKSCYTKLNISENDNWLFFHSYCFDFSVWEIFGSLLSGGTLLLTQGENTKNVESLSALMKKFETTVFCQTPSSFYNFIDFAQKVPSLRYVIFGGEALNPSKLDVWAKENPEVDLINMYGITETTVHVTFKKLDETDLLSSVSNIGKPLPFAKCYILNQEQQPVPYGRPGELYVSGSGVARGYLNRDALNEERFLTSNTFDVTEVLYRTGDLGRYLDNGDIEYLGRTDDQVKIRGYRIELDEIKRQLEALKGIKQAAVTVFEHTDGDKNIAAYVSTSHTMSQDDVRSYLTSKLPEYMVPAFIIIMDDIPLNANGKIDTSDLPSPLDTLSDVLEEIIEPSTDLETTLFDLWSDVLGVDNFGVKHNFFKIGGHSLKAMKLVNQVNQIYETEMKIVDLFENPTIESLSKWIQEKTQQEEGEAYKELII